MKIGSQEMPCLYKPSPLIIISEDEFPESRPINFRMPDFIRVIATKPNT